MSDRKEGLYIVLLSIHGLIRWNNLELGRDSDTGGQTLYVVELAQALAQLPGVAKVDLVTQRVIDDTVSNDYAVVIDKYSDKLRIVRIDAGPQEYLAKEKLWDHLDAFSDNLHTFWRENQAFPDIIHSHYADAGYVGSQLASLLGIPQVHTGHSLGRVKRNRLLASGLNVDEIENLYNMSQRIEAEEQTLTSAERVITSTHQEIEEQYELYDHYQPDQMRVIPPGTDLKKFSPATGNERSQPLFAELTKHLKEPPKPIILALSRPDQRKNIRSLIEAYGQSEELQQLANLLIIAGNRDDIDDLEEQAQDVFYELFAAVDRYDLYGKVTMPKHHHREDVPLIYQIAAASQGVFVNPALTEPFGLTLIEAAACGLPLVATEDGGPVDIIGNCSNGLLIDPLEPESISKALLKLLKNDNLWQQYAQQGLAGVKANYSWDAHARRYFNVIKPIAERSERLQRKPVKQRPGLYRDRAIVTDLDQNLIGDATSRRELVQLIRQHRTDGYFIIATGRRLNSAMKFMKQYNIPEPDVLIAGSGSEIYYAPKFTADTAWTRHIDFQWSPRAVKQLLVDLPGLKIQPIQERSFYKLSYYIDPKKADVEEIKQLLHKEELSFHLQFAFGQFLDIMPLRASKGMALRYVAERLNLPLQSVFVAGGSGADEDMMRGNTLAAVVANRHHEEMSQLIDLDRIYFSTKPCAAGILEALEFYDFFGNCRDPREEKGDNG